MAGADRITTWAEDRFYGDNVVLRENSDYQRIVVTSGPAGVRLFLNGNLQFHSRDEYRYHEALVHPAMAAHGAPRRVLVLGGGDGMAVREVLKPRVEQVTLVELDPHMTRLFATPAAAEGAERRRAAFARAEDRQRRRLRLAGSAATRCST
jgi:spermidine synthase